MPSKDDITALIHRRRMASLLINIERLQRLAILFDFFYEEYWMVPPSEVPRAVYRHWFNEVLNIPKNPKSLIPHKPLEIYAEPKDYVWMLSQLLE